MYTFNIKLFSQILSHLHITEILKFFSKLLSKKYQKICKYESIWRKLLLRDYGCFSNIQDQIKSESNMKLYLIYREFYFSPILNSPDFTEVYSIMLNSCSSFDHRVYFVNDGHNLSILPKCDEKIIFVLPLEFIESKKEDLIPQKFETEHIPFKLELNSGDLVPILIMYGKVQNGIFFFKRKEMEY